MAMRNLSRKVFRGYSSLFALLLFSSAVSFGQNTTHPLQKEAINSKIDSILLTPKTVAREEQKKDVERFAANAYKQSLANYEEHRLVLMQTKSFITINSEINKANGFIKQGYDYKKILDNTSGFLKMKDIATNGVINSPDYIISNRNLTTTALILDELIRRNNIWLNETLKFHRSLGTIQHKIDSIAKDSLLYKVPSDSAYRINYFIKLTTLKERLTPVNKSLSGALDSIQQVELQVNQINSLLESNITEIAFQRKLLQENIKKREVTAFWKNSSERSITEIIAFSAHKLIILIGFYLANHFFAIISWLVFTLIIAFYIRFLIRRTKGAEVFDAIKEKSFLLTHPISSSILISTSIMQLIFPKPPLLISGIFWLISLFALSFILWKSITRKWMKAWVTFISLFIITLSINMLLTHSGIEGVLILINSLIGAVIGFSILKAMKDKVLNNYKAFLPLITMVAFETLAIILLVLGRYNLAKTIMSNGYFLMIVSFLIFWTFKLMNDALIISRFFQIRVENKQHLFDYKDFEWKESRLAHLLIGAGTIYLVVRTSYSYQAFINPILEAFETPRYFGKINYTYESIFIFFLILTLSWMLAKVVSLLTTDSDQQRDSQSEGGPGSWILLARIFIFTVGIIFACLAAGIPLDRISVIIGALSVGIGFGLQTLINNLVSGLIIAFEKPINVGDVVEISGQVGKMKSIGIRSSVVTTWDGADVIIPNGDLMNQHLINWTLGNTQRRVDLIVGVAYGSDLEFVKNLLYQTLENEKRILKYPEPFIQVMQFNNSSIDFVLKFWVTHFAIGMDVKSDLIIAIDKLFKEKNITIPFPQLDVHNIPIDKLPEEE